MDKPIYRKSVLDPNGAIDVTAYLAGGSGPSVEITQGQETLIISSSFGRSLAGVIAAAVAKLEEAQQSAVA